MHWSQQTPSSNNTREDSTHEHHQTVNTKIRLIIFFAAKDGEALYSQQKQYPAVDVTGDRSKVWCCKEQYCIVTWNVRSINQGRLEVVKQEMSRVNVNILGISELKWIGMDEFNSDDLYIYYSGQESLRRNGVAIIVNKRAQKCSTWMQPQKWQNDLYSFLRTTIQYHSNPSLCPNQ